MAQLSGATQARETMDKEECNRQFSPTLWSKRIIQPFEGSNEHPVVDAHIKALQEGTARGKAVAETILDVSYGPGDDEKMDIYMPLKPNPAPPVFVYIHGGYWRILGKEFSGYMVPPLVESGAVVVALSYTLSPKGSMDLMVDQMRRAVAFISRQYSHFSGIYLCGHSAGAHLAAMVLATDWSLPEYGVTPDIKGAFLLSGVFDIRPLVQTYVNEHLKMTLEDMARNSPMLKVDAMAPLAGKCHIVLAVAEHDTTEFHRQSRELEQSLKSAGFNVTFLDVPNVDHFDLVEKFCSEEYQLTQVIKEVMFGGVKP
uniref:Kynurenine formamidase n=1 Tax=Petromyzon marinus TaxID=7757 RepID=A0AAJ7WYT3_PETMA|nr:kynurenine formamidase [Petromyzon marinus]